jgi:arylsulfatase
VPSHASLFTGKYPVEVGTHAYNPHLNPEETTLVEKFRNSGFETVGLSNNVWVDPFYGFDKGFGTFYRGPNSYGLPKQNESEFDWEEFIHTRSGISKYVRGVKEAIQDNSNTFATIKEGLQRVIFGNIQMNQENRLDWLIKNIDQHTFDSDSFVFMNLMTCHFPYNPPEEYQTGDVLHDHPLELVFNEDNYNESDLQKHLARYRDCARYLDEKLEEIVQKIDWDMLFIIGDHGELFGEHDLREHWYGLYEELIHVPGIVIGSEVPAGITEVPVSLIDINKTLVEKAGLADGGRGQNIFREPKSDRLIYAESVGSDRYAEDAEGLESNIPPSWDEHYSMIRCGNAKIISDEDGVQIKDLTGEGVSDEILEHLKQEINHRKPDGENTSGRGNDAPEEIQNRLSDLGYL